MSGSGGDDQQWNFSVGCCRICSDKNEELTFTVFNFWVLFCWGVSDLIIDLQLHTHFPNNPSTSSRIYTEDGSSKKSSKQSANELKY